MGSTTSDESCNKRDDTGSESNCYCYSQPEINFEYSTCAIPNVALDTGTQDMKTEQQQELEKLLDYKTDQRTQIEALEQSKNAIKAELAIEVETA